MLVGWAVGAGSAVGAPPGLVPFTEEASRRGIFYIPSQIVPFGEGVAMADLDGDGDLDLIVLGDLNGRIGIYENDGAGTFIDRSAGIGGMHALASGVTAVDVDRDGDLDLHVTRRGLPDRLFRNDGGFSFTDIASAAGVAHVGDGHGAAWADVDGDGWLDLYLCNRDGPNALFINLGPDARGGVQFVDRALAYGVDAGNSPSFAASFLDFDEDGDPDLYLANDHGTNCGVYRNHLFRNDGGHFVDVTDEATQGCLDAMCVAVGDFDGDGRQDLFSTNNPLGHALMLNGGDGPWQRAEVQAGVTGNAWGWGATFLDFDHDGRLDLYVCHSSSTNRLYHNTPIWPTQDVSAAMAVDDPGVSYSVAAGDVDGDGDLDLLVSVRQGGIRLFINQTGQQRRWLQADVVGVGEPAAVSGRAPAPAIGALVRVTAGRLSMVREVRAGTGFKSQDGMRLHFGMDDRPRADSIHVRWPHGTDERVLRNYGASRTWTIWPTGRLGDMDHDGVRGASDLPLLAACWTGDRPGALSVGCELADLDGDADVDADDVLAFVQGGYVGWQGDCDGDGICDVLAIVSGLVADDDGDGRPDACAVIVPGDLTGDGRVDAADVQLLLGHWGGTDEWMDLDADGVVGFGDLLILLGAWTG